VHLFASILAHLWAFPFPSIALPLSQSSYFPVCLILHSDQLEKAVTVCLCSSHFPTPCWCLLLFHFLVFSLPTLFDNIHILRFARMVLLIMDLSPLSCSALFAGQMSSSPAGDPALHQRRFTCKPFLLILRKVVPSTFWRPPLFLSPKKCLGLFSGLPIATPAIHLSHALRAREALSMVLSSLRAAVKLSVTPTFFALRWIAGFEFFFPRLCSSPAHFYPLPPNWWVFLISGCFFFFVFSCAPDKFSRFSPTWFADSCGKRFFEPPDTSFRLEFLSLFQVFFFSCHALSPPLVATRSSRLTPSTCSLEISSCYAFTQPVTFTTLR